MKIHSIVADSPGCLRTRETTCACNDCFNENGFLDGSVCLQMKQKLIVTKPKTTCADKEIATEQDSNIEANDSEVLQSDEQN